MPARAYAHRVRRSPCVAIVASALLAVTAVAAPLPARAEADYSSFFWQRELADAGWAACEEPVTWSVDVRGLTSTQARREIRRLEQAWGQWTAASGIPVQFTGRESLVFDPGTNGLRRPDGSPQPDRHVYLAFKTQRQVPIMIRGIIGLAMPSTVLVPSREIVAGVAVFRRSFVLEQRKVEPDRVLHLYLHELGHVLGLGHAGKQDNVMYPSIDHLTELGLGDRAGIEAFTQPCTRLPGTTPTGETAVRVTEWRE